MKTDGTGEALARQAREMVRRVLAEIDNLNANNLSLTIMALIACGGSRRSELLDELHYRLLEKQLADGSWMEELWATGLALQAIDACSDIAGQRPATAEHIERALRWIRRNKNPKRSNWQGEFLETALLCWILPSVLPPDHEDNVFVRDAVGCLRRSQRPEGNFFDVYDTALALAAFGATAAAFGLEHDEAIAKCVDWLKGWGSDEETAWCRALTLLVAVRHTPQEREWMATIASHLTREEFAQGDYDEQAMTVWALSEYQKLVRPRVGRGRVIKLDDIGRAAFVSVLSDVGGTRTPFKALRAHLMRLKDRGTRSDLDGLIIGVRIATEAMLRHAAVHEGDRPPPRDAMSYLLQALKERGALDDEARMSVETIQRWANAVIHPAIRSLSEFSETIATRQNATAVLAAFGNVLKWFHARYSARQEA